MQERRGRHRVQQWLNVGISTRRTASNRVRGTLSCRLDALLVLDLHPARLREFQRGYRATASPAHRRYQDSRELVRSLRLPLKSPSAWLATVIA